MQEHPSLDTHEESYFASFTDMLVGIIFIFIILLMIVANNYQDATEAVIQANQALENARNTARDKARDAAHDKALNAAHAKEIAKIQLEAARAMEEVKVLEAAKAFQEAKAREIEQSMQASPPVVENTPAQAAAAAKANDEAIIRQRLMDTQQNMFNDSRRKVLERIKEDLDAEGFDVRANLNQGTLLIPEHVLFDLKEGEVSFMGKQAVYALATDFGKYLPCISPTADTSRLVACSGLNFTPNDGLDVIFIDDYPDINASREDTLLLSVHRIVSLFNNLKGFNPYLDRELKNISGVPILDIKVNQERRKAWKNWDQANPAVRKFVVLRFIMRKPNQQDILKLRNSADTGLAQ